MKTVRIFKYIEELDCFVVNPVYKELANRLGLTEWNEVVWIGRYFSLDNDTGEHWFDNWELRNKISSQSNSLGIELDDLLIVDPTKFKNGLDGPVHSEFERKRFWTDVLKSLELSLETIFSEAEKLNSERMKSDDDYIHELATRINEIRKAYLYTG